MDYLITIYFSYISDEHYFILFVINYYIRTIIVFNFQNCKIIIMLFIKPIVSFIKYTMIYGDNTFHDYTQVPIHVYIMRMCFNNAINYNLLTH